MSIRFGRETNVYSASWFLVLYSRLLLLQSVCIHNPSQQSQIHVNEKQLAKLGQSILMYAQHFNCSSFCLTLPVRLSVSVSLSNSLFVFLFRNPLLSYEEQSFS